MSLLDWIRSNDDENTNLNLVADHCTKALEQMDHQLLVNLEKHIESSLDSAERPEMKAIVPNVLYSLMGDQMNGLRRTTK